MNNTESAEERLRELEIKITFIDDYVSQQNRTILELSKEVEKLTRALRLLSEKTDALGDGNIPPANEKPPHW